MPFRKILVTLDGSRMAEAALRFANKVAAHDAHITLLSITEEDWMPSMALAGVTGFVTPLSTAVSSTQEPMAVMHTRHYLEQTALRIARDGLTVACDVRLGNVVDTIVETAKQGEFDLIVMSTHGRTGVGKMLLGSVVSEVLPIAPCPVLTVPPAVTAKYNTRPLQP
jgi:nucleotide-binding universal stress UspA family protein